MKGFGLWFLLFLVGGTCLICLTFSSKATTSIIHGKSFPRHQSDVTLTGPSRKLKDNIHGQGSHKRWDAEGVNVEDYHPIDPAPSSKASVRPGPIQHGTPLMPFIPKPSPNPSPDHPKHGKLRLSLGIGNWGNTLHKKLREIFSSSDSKV